MRRLVDFFDSKRFTALLVGIVSLATFGQMDNDWHAIGLSLFVVAAYWLIIGVDPEGSAAPVGRAEPNL